MIQEATDRVRQMELYFDILQKAANDDPDALREDASIKSILQILVQYYEGGQWQRDYELDEEGFLPQDLKRGVLSQDAVFDFFAQIKSADSAEDPTPM